MNVLIIGAGMYVTGRNQTGNATVLASLCQVSKQLHVRRVTVAAKNPANESLLLSTAEGINHKIGSKLAVWRGDLSPRTLDLLAVEWSQGKGHRKMKPASDD